MPKSRTHVFEGVGTGGVVIGYALNLHHNPEVKPASAPALAEIGRFRDAQEEVEYDLKMLLDLAPEGLSRQQLSIIETGNAILHDSRLTDMIINDIKLARLSAEEAIQKSYHQAAIRISDLKDALLSSRASNFLEIGRRLNRRLTGRHLKSDCVPRLVPGCLICSADMGPGELVELYLAGIRGFCLDTGNSHSHTIEIANALLLPGIVGTECITNYSRSGDQVILDGKIGRLILNPSKEDVDRYTRQPDVHIAKDPNTLRTSVSPRIHYDSSPVFPPAWASIWGEDNCGLFADIEFRGVVQRMRWIPPGEFLMGARSGKKARRKFSGLPQHVVLSEGFWLADTPCTQEFWQAVMGENPSQHGGQSQLPVTEVNWDDCHIFFHRVHHASPLLQLALPTESQWEYACRAGSETRWFFGNETKSLNDYVWYRGNSEGQTHPVKEKRPNPWGLYDTHGNVWEWCSDWWREPKDLSWSDNPEESDEFKAVRGGSWFNDASRCQSVARYGDRPNYRSDGLGFRFVCKGSRETAY